MGEGVEAATPPEEILPALEILMALENFGSTPGTAETGQETENQ
jgi:hypothetical protein